MLPSRIIIEVEVERWGMGKHLFYCGKKFRRNALRANVKRYTMISFIVGLSTYNILLHFQKNMDKIVNRMSIP